MNLKYITQARIPTERAHGTQMVKMCEAFADHGMNVSLITPRKKSAPGTDDIFTHYGVKRNFSIHRLWSTDFLGGTYHLGRFFYWIDNITYLLSLFSSNIISKGDIVYSRDPILLFLFSPKKYNLCLELHTVPDNGFFMSRFLKKIHKIIVLNSIIKSELVSRGLNSERIFVAADAVSIKDFQTDVSREEARTKLHLPREGFLVLYAGHFYGWKGVDFFAESSSLLPQFNFVCVGGIEPEYSDFKKRFGGIKNLTILPFQNRSLVSSFLTAADVLVLPNSGKSPISSKYTSPLKLFEYMAAKRPIVSSDLPSLREVLNEGNAFFAKPDDSKSLADAITLALMEKDSAQKKSEQAFFDVQKYTWEARAKSIANFISR